MDEIQKKLLLTEHDHEPGFFSHKNLFTMSPLLFAAGGLIIGILLQSATPLPLRLWMLLLLFCGIAAIAIFIFSKNTRPAWPLACTTLLCFVCLGAVRFESSRRPAADDISKFIKTSRAIATIRGQIITEPYVRKSDWKFSKFVTTDPVSSFYLRVTEVLATTGWAKAGGTVRVQVNQPVLDLKPGDDVRIYCWLERFSPPTNPGQFNTAEYMALRKVYLAASVDNRDAIELITGGAARKSSLLRRTAWSLRTAAMKLLHSGLDDDDISAGLLEALLLGLRGDFDIKTYNAFIKTGLLHLISLSGMHLVILMGMLWWLCKTAGLMKPARAVFCLAALTIFVLVVPPKDPTLRAAIISAVFCLSFLFYRKSNSFNSLSLAAIILLLINPSGLFDAGWQLSFASVLGILLLTRPIENLFYKYTPARLLLANTAKLSLWQRGSIWVGKQILIGFAATVAAWLASFGILLYHFYTVFPLTMLWTVLVSPFVSLLLIVGYLKIVLALILPTAGAILAPFITLLSDILIWLVIFIADLNISQILTGRVSLVFIAIFYVYLFFILFVRFKRPQFKNIVSITLAAAMIFFLGFTKWQKTHRDDLTINCLDVGHGQALIAQLPGSANILFDAGSLFTNDVGRRIVTPFLNRSGIATLDCIALSHGDVDHINGVCEIVENVKVKNVFAGPTLLEKPAATTTLLHEFLKEQNLPIQPLGNTLDLSGSADVKVIWPNEAASKDTSLSDNDKSSVFLISFAGRKILVCSDIENHSQQRLLSQFPDLTADVVIVPHHGSAKTIHPGFLEYLAPEILICSCGQAQYERNQITPPIPGARTLYTPADGAITVTIQENGNIKISTFLGRK